MEEIVQKALDAVFSQYEKLYQQYYKTLCLSHSYPSYNRVEEARKMAFEDTKRLVDDVVKRFNDRFKETLEEALSKFEEKTKKQNGFQRQ